jgi:hypothetical protein
MTTHLATSHDRWNDSINDTNHIDNALLQIHEGIIDSESSRCVLVYVLKAKTCDTVTTLLYTNITNLRRSSGLANPE